MTRSVFPKPYAPAPGIHVGSAGRLTWICELRCDSAEHTLQGEMRQTLHNYDQVNAGGFLLPHLRHQIKRTCRRVSEGHDTSTTVTEQFRQHRAAYGISVRNCPASGTDKPLMEVL